MSAKTLAQTTPPAARTPRRRDQVIGLSLLALVAAVAMTFAVTRARAPEAQLTQPATSDPAAQSVLNYITVHRAVEGSSSVVIDPAVLGVNGYLQAHALVAQAPASDPAAQSVLNYITVHRAVESSSSVVTDPAVLGRPYYSGNFVR
jgi:hypothetical protein